MSRGRIKVRILTCLCWIFGGAALFAAIGYAAYESWPWVSEQQPAMAAALIAGAFTSVTALCALIGVWLTLKHHRKREREGREDEMIRQACFDFIETVAKVFEALALMASPGKNDEKIQSLFASYGASFGRVHLVGDMRVEKAAVCFNEQFQVLSYPLFEKRRMVNTRNATVDSIGKRLSEIADYLRQKVTADAGSLTPEAQGALNQFNSLVEQDKVERAELARLGLELANEQNEVVLKLTDADNELLLALRKRLGFKINEPDYLNVVNQSAAKLSAFKRDNIRKAMEKVLAATPK